MHITDTNPFQQPLDESNCKPNVIWVYKGSEFYKRSMKSWLKDKGKFVVAERFIKTLKNRIYKYMTLVSYDAYIDKLCYILNKYNKAYHTTIKTKPIDAKSSTYIDFNKKIINKVLNFKLVNM